MGSVDCGLFTVAFAAVLAEVKHPSAYLFEQENMRQHLHTCKQVKGKKEPGGEGVLQLPNAGKLFRMYDHVSQICRE